MRDEFRNPITKAVYQLVDGMCQHPGTLKLDEAESDNNLVITLRPSTADIRLIVGRDGAGINALTYLVEQAGRIAGAKHLLILNDDFSGRSEGPRAFVSDPKFDLEAFKRLLASWNALVFGNAVGMTFTRAGRDLRVSLDSEDVTAIRALSQVFYPYGYRQGCIIKIRPCEMVKPG